MYSVSRSLQSFQSEIAHIRRIVAQANWDQRPTFCYRLRAALREALASAGRSADIDQRMRTVMRAAEHFSNALRPNFTPATLDLMARIAEFESAGASALMALTKDRQKAA